MTGFSERMKRIEELLERIITSVPDFRGYHSREYIYDSDRVLRHYLATEMERYRRALELIRERMFLEGRLTSRDRLEETILRMKNLEQRFREESYVKGEPEETRELSALELERLYEFDLAILDHIEGLNTPIDKLEELTDSQELFDAELDFLNEAIDNIEEHLKKRGRFIG